MAYEKQTWVDGVSPLNAERFNHMEDGIANNATEVERIVAKIDKALPSETKLKQYAALFNGTDEVEGFLFLTDPHVINWTTMSENQKTVTGDLQIIRDYYTSTPTSFVLCTGDWINDDYTGDEACFLLGMVRGLWKTWFDNGCFAVGNHEYNDCGEQILDTNTVHNLLLPHEEKNYYTYDGNRTKFYVLDTGRLGTGHTEYGWEQIDWLAKKLIEDNAEHSAIASHIWYIADEDGTLVLTPFADAVLRLAQAYNDRTTITLNEKTYDFVSATGYVEFAMGGHKHVDKNAEEYGIPVILSTTVTINGYGKPTFDLVLVNYTNRKINFVRIGSHKDRTVLLAQRGDEEYVNYTNLVPTSLATDSDEVYNNIGYKNNTRAASTPAPSYEAEYSGFVRTGLIPYKVSNRPNLPSIYFKGSFHTNYTDPMPMIAWFKSDKTYTRANQLFLEDYSNWPFKVVELDTGYYRLDFTYNDSGVPKILNSVGYADYFVLSLAGVGEGLVVTIGEPIE